jgi:hypothetical protein
VDNCVSNPNPDQLDTDSDGMGDPCDPCPLGNGDDDNDGACNGGDNCPSVFNNDQADSDADLAGDACDNCPGLANVGQANADGDAAGDACDVCPNAAPNDSDGDGVCQNVDNCPSLYNPTQANNDGDSRGNDCEQCRNDPNKLSAGFCGCGQPETNTDGDSHPDCDDQCPTDPNKVLSGYCGCGLADTNTDGDGHPDCADECPNDPLKYEPLLCGCGVAEGTCNNDGCPSDPLKTAPGVCGCGVADTDTDGDGTANCIDACPSDASKTAAGACGCGVADTDGDSDGTANCNDACASDPNKIAAGACGCGVADTDGDSDGTPNCNDGCPTDSNKVTAGACGCGVADTDSDSDGTANCVDGCASDPLKTAAGACGCGVADTDGDSDGTSNCNDGCPTDANKVAAGTCGCGVSDTDVDSDGTPNCNDACASDPLKIATGVCGCGVADVDGDSDGMPNCNDGCPTDSNKVTAGACGCGVADTDSDSDGTANCVDGCVNDPLKTAAGACGCGVADTDGDSDGTANCNDGCPSDANKVAAGACGCGVADSDSDSDGTPNCNDACASDPLKIAAGVCGCGVADADGDSDGTPNCNDGCPTDANKVAAGACGCGVADVDADSNSIIDCLASGDEILLQTCADLQAIDNNLTASYRLLNDIDCTGFDYGDGKGFKPIAEGPEWEPFMGTLDGAGFVVTGLMIDRPEDGWVGLFGLTDGATISQLGLVNVSIEGYYEVGALIGHASNTDVREVLASGAVSGGWNVAGLIGAPKDQTHVADCAVHVAVSSNESEQGLIGALMYYDALIERSYSAGTTTGLSAVVHSPEEGSIVRTSFFDCDVAGNCADDMAASTTEMTSAAQYAAAGWDFDTVWGFFEDHDYPCLRWQDGCTCVAGQDLDQDGTLDCDESCAIDPLKVEPGACGCGAVEVDTDSDGTFDCDDVCPNDPLKIERGECGCGIADVDTNEDELLDCNDPATPAGISTCAELQDITNLHGAFVLENDIDCTGFDYGDGRGFMPIASANNGWAPFEGHFDGAGYAITGLTINRPHDSLVGLFGHAAHGTIRNLALYGAQVTGNQRVGALVGHSHWVSFEQCVATGEVIGNDAIGGLIGLMGAGTLHDSYATSTVFGWVDVGLVVGAHEGELRRTYSAGEGGDPAALAGGRGYGGVSFASFFDCEVAGNCSDAEAANTASMTSIDQYAESGWDFDHVWGFSELGGYPCLRWEAGCGCIATDDFDGDSANNCADECSTDPAKTVPGVCGCGAADVDSDSDGTIDCNDECPTDPLKIEHGECGCGTADVDLNEDEVLDCNDPATPVGISTCAELQGITNMYGAFVLENDVDCTGFDSGDGRGFRPIGSVEGWTPFEGRFDGAGYIIEGLSMQRQFDWHTGLFRDAYGAWIRNVTLRDANIAGGTRVGGVVGIATNTLIQQCSVTGAVSGSDNVGGLVGFAENSALSDSYASAVVSAWGPLGLLVGSLNGAFALERCYASGDAEGDVELFGELNGEGDITASFFDCDVAGNCTATGATTTTAMQSSTLYTTAGWDFTNIWGFNGSGMYPCLRVEASCAP